MVRLSWLSFLGQFRKHLYVALIFGIDLAQPRNELLELAQSSSFWLLALSSSSSSNHFRISEHFQSFFRESVWLIWVIWVKLGSVGTTY